MLKLDRLVHRPTLFLALCLLPATRLPAQTVAAPEQSAAPTLLSPGSFAALDPQAKSLYLQGVIAHWQSSAEGRDFAFVEAAVATAVTPAGDLRLPPAQAQPFGRAILLSYRVSGNPALYRAAKQLRDLLQPQQDKADMAVAPFLADFGVTVGDVSAAEQAADILLRIDTTGRDLDTGLLHGSGPIVDLSRNTLYALDLLETIDRLPIGFHHRRGLTEALNKTVSALIARQGNHAVWQSPGQSTQTLLLNAYVVARAVRFGELAGSDATLAQQMADTAHSATVSSADEGARLLAQSEADQVATQAYGQGKTVVADGWFTAEPRTNAAGKREASPAKWDDDADKGLSFLGHTFERYGMQLDTLRVAPTAASLSSAQIYIMAAPSNNFSHEVKKQDADALETWVKDGGVLVLMGNEVDKEALPGLGPLADRFGMHFSPLDKTKSQGKEAGQDVVPIPAGDTVFPRSHRVFVQGISTLTLSPLAHPVLKNGDGVVMAVASVGRGTVLTIADPWLWNEYLDGRKVVPPSDNFAAAIDLAGWILKQTQQ